MKAVKGRRIASFALLAAALVASGVARGVTPLGTNELARITQARTYVSDALEMMPYRLYVPDDLAPTGRVPLVVYLHGSGACGVDNLLNLRDGPDSMITYSRVSHTPVIVVSPQCPRGQVWAPLFWTPETARSFPAPTKMGKLVKELIDQCIETLPVDTNAVLLTGVSLGGYGVWDLLAHYPKLFAAAMPVCGGGVPDTCKRFADTPIWIFHGERDGSVSVKLARDMVSELWRLDAPVRYRETPDAGHAVWGVYREDSVLKWFFSRRRAAAPAPKPKPR